MSEKRKIASQTNGRRSRGPKTEEGRNAVRHNALKHGILAKATLLPHEDPALFEALRDELRSATRPVGALEDNLVEMIASYAWRLRRVVQVEAGLFTKQIYETRERDARYEAESFRRRPPGEKPSAIEALMEDLTENRDNWIIVDKPGHTSALERADAARTQLKADDVEIGTAFAEDATRADAFSKLSRYETTIERALFKTLNELRVLQEKREQGTEPISARRELQASPPQEPELPAS
jgi:hypothetical protein